MTADTCEEAGSREKATFAFPFLDLSHQFESIQDELESSVLRVLRSQRFILGHEVEAFEAEIAAWNSSRAAIACASGSDAVLLALMALDVAPGDEVITTPFTFVATGTAITRLGATPVFADIEPGAFNLDPTQVESAITRRTRAIIPVHLFGCPADLAPIIAIAEANSIPVIEDAAQAIGAKYRGRQIGTIGQIGCFSFYPTKNLGCAGDGGLVVTNDEQLTERLRILHVHGSRTRYSYDVIGINSRLDALQAAILRVKLPHLDDWTRARRRNADQYSRLFSKYSLDSHVRLPKAPDYAHHVYNQFTIRTSDRDRLRAYLRDSGIPTEIYYPFPLHLEPAFSYLGKKPGDYPEAERAPREVLSLPIYPGLSIEHQMQVVEAIARFYGK
ncbi:MAG: DegT/DnrJ/EryC1/StrS family aminotransferase [Acidobacteriaceae bacterium]|nr:DegT/DnrJ/EryC1/StrS family aminotransferase [Acidobacteriaceae bacterium]MBV9782122.1 DegT/DnrJ/EryC1/StrS family aminotransferase [Acidobacteriaceae bacterium]